MPKRKSFLGNNSVSSKKSFDATIVRRTSKTRSVQENHENSDISTGLDDDEDEEGQWVGSLRSAKTI
jgi:hypothetical protein